MKRLYALLLTVCLLCVSCMGFAEQQGEFSIRNGIKFGMTKKEVRKIETWPIENDKLPSFTTYGPTTMLGIASSSASYYYDENGKLYRITYSLGEGQTKGVTRANYDKIVDALTQKYGEPLAIPKGKTYRYTTPLLDIIIRTYLNSAVKGNYQLEYEYQEWALQYDTGLVKIDCLYLYAKDSGAKCLLSYMFFDKVVDATILNDI